MSDRDTYAGWAADVGAIGGVATNWPFSSGTYGQYYGQPAARFPAATYAALFNAGQIDPSAPQQSTPSGAYIYVLASALVQRAASTLTQPTQQDLAVIAKANDSWWKQLGLAFDVPPWVVPAAVAVIGLPIVFSVTRAFRPNPPRRRRR